MSKRKRKAGFNPKPEHSAHAPVKEGMALDLHPKSYKIKFENHPEYLLASVSGDKVSLEIYRQYWAEIVQEVLKHNPKALLVWEDFAETISTQDTFTLVSELCQLTQFLHLRIAFLDEHLAQMNRNKLAEMIATNRGFTFRVCSSLHDARTWLNNK